MIIHNLTQLTKQKNEYNLLAGGIVTFLAFFLFTSQATIV